MSLKSDGIGARYIGEEMKRSEREAVWLKYDKRCAYCGNELEYKNMQVDHYIPQAMGHLASFHGLESVDSFENLMPSCRRCNHYKGAMMPEAFARRMETLHERVAQQYIVKVAIDYGIVQIKPFSGKFYFELFG